jgi:predicted nucleotidyltransferase
MDQWTPYPAIDELVRDLLGRVQDIVGSEFVGMYLYGSLANGDFQPDRSDVDVVVATVDVLAEPVVSALAAMHRALVSEGHSRAAKLEVAYLPAHVLRRHDPAHPPVPILNEGEFCAELLGSDWMIQRHQLRSEGIVISGPALTAMIDPIDAQALQLAVRANLREWWAPMLERPARLHDYGYQPYAVLSMCRTSYTLEYATQVSKSVAARWALQTLPQEWTPLVEAALTWRSGVTSGSVGRTLEFIRHTIDRSDGLVGRSASTPKPG